MAQRLFFNTVMKKLFYTLGLIIPIALISCVTDEVELECDLSHKGMIVDWTGCDGCSYIICLLYTSPSPRDRTRSRMPSSA